MIDNNTTIQPAKVRVSIFERIVPFAAFAVAALGGGVGAAILQIMMSSSSSALSGRRNALWAAAIGLCLGAVLGLAAMGVAIYRMFAKTTTASPSGISYLVLGLLGLVPAAIVWRAAALVLAVMNLGEGDLNQVSMSYWAETYVLAGLIATPVILILLLAFSLIPFKSQPGRRFGPIITLAIMELVLVAAAAAFLLYAF